LLFAPRLPSRLARLSFGIVYRSRRLRIEVRADNATYELLDGEPIELIHHGERITVSAKEPLTLPVPPTPQRPVPRSPAGREPTSID